jgi:hypothetical protein
MAGVVRKAEGKETGDLTQPLRYGNGNGPDQFAPDRPREFCCRELLPERLFEKRYAAKCAGFDPFPNRPTPNVSGRAEVSATLSNVLGADIQVERAEPGFIFLQVGAEQDP